MSDGAPGFTILDVVVGIQMLVAFALGWRTGRLLRAWWAARRGRKRSG